MNLRYVAAVSVCVSALWTQARAVDFDVSTAGTDTGSCGVAANPNCKTIGFALGTRATAAPDQVLVMDGTYDTALGESFPIALKNGVSIVGNIATPQNVVVRSPANTFVSAGPLSASTVISGLTIMPGTTNTLDNTAIHIDTISGSDEVKPIIENNRFIGGGTGVDVHNNDTANSADVAPTIRNNFFSGQTFAGIHLLADESGTAQMLQGMISSNTIDSADEGILVEGTEEVSGLIAPTIKMNTINDPVGDGIDVSLSRLTNTSNSVTVRPLITQNTIINPGDDGIDVDFDQRDFAFAPNGFVRFEPTITGNTITGNGSGDAGIAVEISDFGSSSVTNLSVTADITITGNTVTGMGGNGIQLEVTDIESMSSGRFALKATISDNTMASGNGGNGINVLLSDWDHISSVAVGTFEIKGNTVDGNGGAGIVVAAVDITSSASGFDFSPTIANNTVTGNLGASTGIAMHFSESGVAGTAVLSGNTITGNNGTGVLLLFGGTRGAAGGPVNVALRGNTITGNSGDAIQIAGTSSPSVTGASGAALQQAAPSSPARGDYAVDLGGGFMGGNGLNAIQGNTASGAGGTCADGGFCDVNNNGPEDVAALCNEFTETDIVTEEDWLNDADNDGSRGDVTPISACVVITPTPTATATATQTATATATQTATATATVTATNTATATLIPDGVVCDGASQCSSGFCSGGVCCDSACDGPLDICNLPAREGVCVEAVAPAPATSPRGLLFGIVLLMLIAGLSLARLRRA